MKNKKNIIVAIFIVSLIFVATFFATYSWFKWQNSSSDTISINLNPNSLITFYNGPNIKETLSPVSSYDRGIVKTIKVISYESGNFFDLNLDVNYIDDALKSASFKWAVYDKNNVLVNSGNFLSCNSGDSITIINDRGISNGVEDTYNIYFWIDSSEQNDLDMINKKVDMILYATESSMNITPISDFEYYTGTYTSPNGTVTIPSNQVLLVKYNGSDTTVNIPATYSINGNEYVTTLYGYQAKSFLDCKSVFINNQTIQHVNFVDNDVLFASNNYVSDTLTYNKMLFTFYGCTSLIDINIIPSNVVAMHSTFLNCTSLLTSPAIPANLTTFYQPFKGCSSLTGSILINSSSISNTTSAFNDTVLPITLKVPNNSTTYTTFSNSSLPNNVTLTTY